jgi:hypothetical protein
MWLSVSDHPTAIVVLWHSDIMQPTRGIDRGGKHPNEDKITTKALDPKNRIQSTNST